MAETSPSWLVNKDVTKWGVLVDGSSVSGKAFDAAVSFLCYHVAPLIFGWLEAWHSYSGGETVLVCEF